MLLDQGSNFLNIIVVEYELQKGKVLASHSEAIGGADLDRLLWKFFAEKIEKENSIKIKPNSKIGLRLLQRIEKAKHILSTGNEARLEVENALGTLYIYFLDMK